MRLEQNATRRDAPGSMDSERNDVIVIGAGPAGLMCAISAAGKGLKVCVLESNAVAGKKLLLTGAGRCNITHAGPVGNILPRYGDKARFVKRALYHFTSDDLRRFFRTRGLELSDDGGGRIFPATGSGADVLRHLLEACRSGGVTIRHGEAVRFVLPDSTGFEARTDTSVYPADSVVIATGGKSYPATGSTGDGYAFAKALGHTIVPPSSALAPIIVKGYGFGDCAGISLPGVKFAIYRGSGKLHASRGDVLFTHKGLSGPGILDCSRYIEPGDLVALSLAGFDAGNDFERDLLRALAARPKGLARTCIPGEKIPERLLIRVFEQCGISPCATASSIDRAARKRIVGNFTGCPFEVERLGDFNEAMVTKGGVALGEVNPATMESRKVPRLYFAGEVLDVDGDTGGYNLQFAFSSGALAGDGVRCRSAVR